MNFTCIHCKQSLEIDDDQGSRTVQCPACGKFILVPMPITTAQIIATTQLASQNQHDTPLTSNASQEVNKSEIRIVDFDMPFMSMVRFMIKWAIAAIPAMAFLFLLYSLIALFMGGCAATMMNGR